MTTRESQEVKQRKILAFKACIIQNFWRKKYDEGVLTSYLFKQFYEILGPKSEWFRALSYSARFASLEFNEVAQPTRKFVTRVLSLVYRIHKDSRPPSDHRLVDIDLFPCKIPLLAFIIVYFTANVFWKIREPEKVKCLFLFGHTSTDDMCAQISFQVLIESARHLVETIEQILVAFLEAPGRGCFHQIPSALTANFPRILEQFMKQYDIWKGQDTLRIVAAMKSRLQQMQEV